MHFNTILVTACLCTTMVLAQRPPYAGQRPTGYKDRLTPPPSSAPTTAPDGAALADRFGANAPTVSPPSISATPPPRLPHLALGDAALVNQLNSRPIDQRPFWLINSEAIEAQKNGTLNRPGSAPATNGIAPFAASSSTINNNNNVRPIAAASNAPPAVGQSTFSVSNRLGEESNKNNANQPQQLQINPNNVISYQEVVYPINTNPIAIPQRQNLPIIVQPYQNQPQQQQQQLILLQWTPQQNSFANNPNSNVAEFFDDDGQSSEEDFY